LGFKKKKEKGKHALGRRSRKNPLGGELGLKKMLRDTTHIVKRATNFLLNTEKRRKTLT